MKVESVIAWGGWLTAVFAVAVCLGIATLLGFGYRATREWQRSSELLIERDTEESADLLVTAVTRDMRGAHSRVLANRDWGELSLESLTDTSDQVATAFARYPYPESFFSWQHDRPQGVVFFNRANRYPAWMPHPTEPHRFPVALITNPPEAEALREKISEFSDGRFRYATFDMTLGGQPYQIVARLVYADPLQETLDSVIGFTVNLAWVRSSYFPDILSQVAPIATRGNLDIAVLDENGTRVWGRNTSGPLLVREFPLLFLDPSVSMVALGSTPAVRTWTIQTGPSNQSPLTGAAQGADEALLAAGAAALTLALGLVLAIRAVRAGVALTAMRSDFVSSVTHELKTPLANIRAMADTLARRPIGGETVRDYAALLMQEAKRLTRLVDNLLAYARVTDVTEIYSFEPIAPAELVDDVLQNFQHPLSEREFTVEVDMPVDLPLVRADRTAMMLTLDNLVDNAIRYSARERFIRISARREGQQVAIEVQDRGAGIAADELSLVRRKFARGKLARADGSGLGLAIVSRIIADHNGTLVLDSEPGTGTTAK
ncbi:MAG TPA: HAMP domain-containing sensor histidine kinase, partial [Vicinamibacterales bacterium]|nr:HAMP domain-containing sensor histidine kinase [Vicinamibacterales bacterium]